MKLILKVLIFLFLFQTFKVNSQNDLLNLKKYWFYRNSLVRDFMVKGDCQGCSLPMTARNYLNLPIKQGEWSDGTIHLANYISVLATEYKLLYDNNQPTDTTLQELCLAIKAFNRLDQTAESYFRCLACPPTPLAGDLNGFFIRDDVDKTTFLINHPSLQTPVIANEAIDAIGSDFSSPDDVRNKEMSHDQIWHLFIGFALISELLDDNPMSQFGLNEVDGNRNIRQEAKNITDRIMGHIRNQDGPPPLKWTIINPITNNNVKRGASVVPLAYGAAEAACFIKNGNTNLDPGYPAHTCNEYHDLESLATSAIWHAAGLGIGAIVSFSPEDNKVQNLAAVGSSWRASETPYFALNVTAERLGARAIFRDYQHLPLVHQVLHGEVPGGATNPISESVYLNLLNTAPCDGPYNFDFPTNSSNFEWSTENRLLYPQRRGEYDHYQAPLDLPGTENDIPERNIGDDKNDFKGEYNGLDYMLYHNLFYIITGAPEKYINFMDRVITFSYPTGPPLNLGAITNPAIVEGFHTVTASNIVNYDADVTYRAGLEVALLPGFEVHAGANFHAYVDPLECASDGEYRSPSNNSNDSSLAPTDNLVAYNGPTTYVYYPKTTENKPSNSVAQSNNKITQNTTTSIFPSGFIISPNPNSGNFLISTIDNKQLTKSKIIVYDIMGNVVKQSEMLESINIDISTEAKGIYFVRIENEQGVKMEKIVFQ